MIKIKKIAVFVIAMVVLLTPSVFVNADSGDLKDPNNAPKGINFRPNDDKGPGPGPVSEEKIQGKEIRSDDGITYLEYRIIMLDNAANNGDSNSRIAATILRGANRVLYAANGEEPMLDKLEKLSCQPAITNDAVSGYIDEPN